MYCSECGHQAAGKFCSNCGSPLGIVDVVLEPEFDWRQSCDFERIVQVPEVRERIDAAKAAAGAKISGSQLLGLFDAVASPLMGGLSSIAIAKVAQPITTKLGFKTGKERREFLLLPPGVVLANLAEALESIEHNLSSVSSDDRQCTLQATLPADLRAMDAKLSVQVERAEDGCWIAAVAMVHGAWHDWGKCKNGINRLFDKLRAA